MKLKRQISSIIRYFVLTPILVLNGKCLCRNHFQDKSTLYVLAFQGIGDSLVTLGFLDEYARKNKFQRIEIFLTEKYEEFYSFYDFPTATKNRVHPNFFKLLKKYFSTSAGFSYLLTHKNILFTDTAVYLGNAWNTTFHMKGLSVFSYIKESIMGVDRESEIETPRITDKHLSNIMQSNEIYGKKVAVLNENSNTVKINSSRTLFEKIAAELNSRGFFVITDLGKNQSESEIKGTVPFFGNLSDSFNLCRISSLIVGVRSGYLDLMLFTGKPILAVYPDDGVFMNAFSLHAMNKCAGKTLNKTVFQCTAKNAISELRKIC